MVTVGIYLMILGALGALAVAASFIRTWRTITTERELWKVAWRYNQITVLVLWPCMFISFVGIVLILAGVVSRG
jgi:hypothetical protein